jgi:hypothetical protein
MFVFLLLYKHYQLRGKFSKTTHHFYDHKIKVLNLVIKVCQGKYSSHKRGTRLFITNGTYSYCQSRLIYYHSINISLLTPSSFVHL